VLPNVSVVAITYPRYETRGDLKDCVSRFREWLENKVIDLEVAKYVWTMVEKGDILTGVVVALPHLQLTLQYIPFS